MITFYYFFASFAASLMLVIVATHANAGDRLFP